jgi:hypothetical protein
MKKKIFKKPPVIEAMEPRLLFSDGLEGVLAQELSVETTTAVSTATLEQLLADSPETTDTRAADETRHEIIFVDTNTPDYQVLVDDLLANQDATRHFEVVLLNNDRDGITQVSEALAIVQDLDAVHIISHGDDGTIDLGDSVLDFEALKANVDAIQAWGDALSAEGDILIYGCNLAATSAGEALVDGLAKLTGADVAASDDLTGNAQLGGDWELEYRTGEVEAETAISIAVQQEWGGVLVTASSGEIAVNTTTADTQATTEGYRSAESVYTRRDSMRTATPSMSREAPASRSSRSPPPRPACNVSRRSPWTTMVISSSSGRGTVPEMPTGSSSVVTTRPVMRWTRPNSSSIPLHPAPR